MKKKIFSCACGYPHRGCHCEFDANGVCVKCGQSKKEHDGQVLEHENLKRSRIKSKNG